MAKTMAQLITSLRDRLDEPTALFWSDNQLRRWLNEGARAITRQTYSLQKKGTVAVTGGTQEYSLPNDLINIHRVEYFKTGDSQRYVLEPRIQNELDQIWWISKEITQAIPQFFYTWGTPGSAVGLKIGLYPIPADSGTINVFYYRYPAEFADGGAGDSTAIELPEGWEDLAVDYAEYNALRKDGNPRWQEAKSLYDEKMGDMMNATNTWAEEVGMISTSTGGMIPEWIYGTGGLY